MCDERGHIDFGFYTIHVTRVIESITHYNCSGSILPYNHFDNDDDFKCSIMEGMLRYWNATYWNGSRYADSHYIQNLSCDYYLEEKYMKKIEDYSTERNFYRFSPNIKSLPKHYDELEIFLKSLGHIFPLLGSQKHGWMKTNMASMTYMNLIITAYIDIERGEWMVGVIVLEKRHTAY